ncbi:hypothetical protein PZ892_11740 [Sphingobacterium sp. WM]|uniref:STM3941 family protein n=1 Tax=Sphingobacterium sp. WM TaxID=3031802 RepID=UPI00240E40A5|nr:STM3941 family protein [Sphingobacterium sp. WM]WFB62346.1 hypothetical protein PZ892_11740 [Sphingobacterium sp. WM]
METTNFKYSQKKLNKMAFYFLIIGVLGAGFVYYSWFIKTEGLVFGRYSSIFLALLGFGAFIYMKLFGKKPDEIALSIGTYGITSNTTPVAKAAELIEWNDIVNIYNEGKFIDIEIRDPQKYAERMKNFFVKDTFMKTMKGFIRISIAEVEVTNQEIDQAISKYQRP